MVEVKNISKKYKNEKILNGISFGVAKGERVAVVGRNGCGKTTLLEILAGAQSPQSGSIRYNNEDPLKNRSVFKKYIGYVPQEDPLIPELTVRDNLKFWGVDKNKDYEYILERFDLKEIIKKEVRNLSGGMKKRLSIACACAKNPQILLLDEPTSSLDIYFKESIFDLLDEYKEKNGTVLISTHEETEIVSCDRVLFIKDGKTVNIEKDPNMMDNIRKLL